MSALECVSTNSDYIEFTGYTAILTDGDFTVEFWLKLTSTSDLQPILGNYINDSNATWWQFQTLVTSNYLVFRIDDGTSIHNAQYSTTLSADTWYHIAGVSDKGSTLKLYVNAVEQGSAVDSGARGNNTTKDLVAGCRYGVDGREYFSDFIISDIRIWNTARTQQQIADNMNRRLAGTETGLIHYWRIDEGTGSTIEDLVGSDDGTITGADWVTDYPGFTTISGTLKEKESDATGSAEHYLIIDPSDGSVLEAGTAESDGSFNIYITDSTTEYALIMPDKDGDYGPTCLNHYVTGV